MESITDQTIPSRISPESTNQTQASAPEVVEPKETPISEPIIEEKPSDVKVEPKEKESVVVPSNGSPVATINETYVFIYHTCGFEFCWIPKKTRF